MIKIVSGYSHACGATSALANLCNQFNSRGYDCVFYGPDHWHKDKCRSGTLNEFAPGAGDIIIAHDLPLVSHDDLSDVSALMVAYGKGGFSATLGRLASRVLSTKASRDYRLFLTCLSDDGLPRSSINLSLFEKIHVASDALARGVGGKRPTFVAPSFAPDLGVTALKPKRAAGILGSIKRGNNIGAAIERALSDGMETVCLYGYMQDPVYYYDTIMPLTLKYRGKIKYAGFVDNKQRLYDAVSDVYAAASKPWSLVGRECAMTGTAYHAPDAASAGGDLTNDRIFDIWKRELAI